MNPAAVVTFFTAIKALFPTGITWQIPNGGDTIEETTGKLTGTWLGTGGGTVTGTGSSVAFAQGVGARIQWQTGNVENGRRVRGTSYMVPLNSSSFDTSGKLVTSTATTLSNAAAALRDAHGGSLCVWGRPKKKTGTPGYHAPITLVQVPTQTSWLRSRKV
jgi:hypothetical protein